MLCPVCRHDNFEGEDYCDNCGADLQSSEIPRSAMGLEGGVLGEHLDALGVGAPSLIEATEPVSAAIRRMREEGVDCLLVMSEGRLVGIFTERDAVLKVAGRMTEAFDVRDVMTEDPVVLRHDDPVAVAVNKMAVGGFRHIPIVDGDRPIGVVAARDVFRHILSVIG
jgi:signal-transduction protein with cAMP-binding, CBS, and nucleotidyltransferase domain